MQKIPSSFIKFLVDISDSNYKVSFDHSKPICELNLKDKAKEILGYIYINWWSDETEKEDCKAEIGKLHAKRQEELNEKYNTDNLFKKNQVKIEEETITESLELVEYKENFFKKIIGKILNFFK